MGSPLDTVYEGLVLLGALDPGAVPITQVIEPAIRVLLDGMRPIN